MRCKFSNQDLSQRLDQTVCRYKGIPYQVRYSGSDELLLYSLNTGKVEFPIRASDPDFDVSTIPLGYVQMNKNTVCYLTRKPSRIYKQGVNNDTLNRTYITPDAKGAFSLFSSYVYDMVVGKYPPVKEALRDLQTLDISREVAISRDVALKWNPDLKITMVYYKNSEVGFIVGNSGTVVIPSTDMAWIISKYLSEYDWKVE